MKDEERQTWSRHYDMLQWAVITIVSAGVGTLVAASFSPGNQLWPEISGLALTILGVLYVASFRTFRGHLHQTIEDRQLRAFLNNPGRTKLFRQWDLFVGSFLIVDILFVYRLTNKCYYPCAVGWILFLAMTLILGAIWARGRGSTETKTDNVNMLACPPAADPQRHSEVEKMTKPRPIDDKYLTEYSATHDAYLHYDTFSWQVGAVLVAAVFVFLGFLLQPDVKDTLLFVAGSTIVAFLMSAWILYAGHNRQIYLQKLDRIHQLEAYLGFQQHLRWIRSESESGPCRYFGPSGHSLNVFVYAVSCVSAPLIGWVKLGFSPWFAMPVCICLAVLLSLWINDRRLGNRQKNLKATKPALNLSEPSSAPDSE